MDLKVNIEYKWGLKRSTVIIQINYIEDTPPHNAF